MVSLLSVQASDLSSFIWTCKVFMVAEYLAPMQHATRTGINDCCMTFVPFHCAVREPFLFPTQNGSCPGSLDAQEWCFTWNSHGKARYYWNLEVHVGCKICALVDHQWDKIFSYYLARLYLILSSHLRFLYFRPYCAIPPASR